MIAYNSSQAAILVSFHSTIAIDGEIKWKHYRDFLPWCINWLIGYCFMTWSRIVCPYRDVTIADERLQNLGLCWADSRDLYCATCSYGFAVSCEVSPRSSRLVNTVDFNKDPNITVRLNVNNKIAFSYSVKCAFYLKI